MAPCFVNGQTDWVAIGGYKGQGVEVWDLKNKESARILKIDSGYICSMASTNNILAVGSSSGALQLRDVRNWDMFHSTTFKGLEPLYLHLTADSKFLTIGGAGGDCCIVMKIK